MSNVFSIFAPSLGGCFGFVNNLRFFFKPFQNQRTISVPMITPTPQRTEGFRKRTGNLSVKKCLLSLTVSNFVPVLGRFLAFQMTDGSGGFYQLFIPLKEPTVFVKEPE
jgi:hypothetical protein